MSQNYDLQLDTIVNGARVPYVGYWVQLVNNDTGTAYVSTAASDGTGKVTFNPKPPGDSYVVNVSLVGPSGPWSAFGISNHNVPVIQGEDPAFHSITGKPSGPYSPAALPGQVVGDVHPWGNGIYDVMSALNPSGAAVADGMVDTNCAIASGSPNLTTTTSPGPFVAADVGKPFYFAGAGAAGVTLRGTVLAFVSSTALTLSVNAGTTVVAGTQGFALGTDNTASFAAATTAATTRGGIVGIPAGSRAGRGFYLDSSGTIGVGCITPASNVWYRGAGINATTIYPSVSYGDARQDLFRLIIPTNQPYATFIQISDMTIDCSGQFVGSALGGVSGTYSNPITMQGCSNIRIERLRIVKPFGFGMVIGTVAGAAPYAQNLTVKDIYFEGGSRNGNDLIGGGGINNMLIDNIVATPSADGINIYGTVYDHTNMTNVSLRNFFCKTAQASPTAPAVATDFGAVRFSMENIYVEGFKYGFLIASTASGQTSDVQIRGAIIKSVTQHGIFFNTAAGFGIQNFVISDCDIIAWDSSAVASAGIKLQGGHDGQIHDNVFGPVTTGYAINFQGDAGSTTVNPPTWIDCHDNDVRQPTNRIFVQYIGAAPAGIYIRNNPGFNPQGGVGGAPAFPATTVSQQNTTGIDWLAYITNGVNAMTAVITAPGGSKTISIPASACVPVLIPANETFTPTYGGGAPTWAIYQL